MNANRSFVLSLPLALMLLVGGASAALADDQGREHENRGGHEAPPRGYVHDNRYNHDRYYPPRGYAVNQLPHEAYVAHYHGGGQYYFNGGVWYRHSGASFIVIAPPFGIGIPFLPPYYTTIWIGGFPYYYADNTYYHWRPEMRQYVVTQPPQDAAAASTTPDRDDEMFVYPKNGQSSQQISTDRYECHSWAVQQTGYDPTQPLGGVDESQVRDKRAAYHRAEAACLEGRGYSVK